MDVEGARRSGTGGEKQKHERCLGHLGFLCEEIVFFSCPKAFKKGFGSPKRTVGSRGVGGATISVRWCLFCFVPGYLLKFYDSSH